MTANHETPTPGARYWDLHWNETVTVAPSPNPYLVAIREYPGAYYGLAVFHKRFRQTGTQS